MMKFSPNLQFFLFDVFPKSYQVSKSDSQLLKISIQSTYKKNMMEGGQDLPEGDDVQLEIIEEDLNRLYFQTVIDAGSKGAIIGPGEIIEDFALVLGDRIGGNRKFNRFLYIKN